MSPLQNGFAFQPGASKNGWVNSRRACVFVALAQGPNDLAVCVCAADRAGVPAQGDLVSFHRVMHRYDVWTLGIVRGRTEW